MTAQVIRADGSVARKDRVGIAAPSSEVSIDFTNARRALVAWGSSPSEAPLGEPAFGPLRIAYARKGGRFLRAQTLEPPAPGQAVPRVAFTSFGAGLVVWSRLHGEPGVTVRAAQLEGTRFGPPQTLRESEATVQAGLVTGGRGEALVAWGDEAGVLASARPPGGSFSAPEQVPVRGGSPVPGIDPATGVPYVFSGGAVAAGPEYATRTPIGR